MARPTFTPDDHQARILNALAKAAQGRKVAEEEADRLIIEAEAAKVPIDHIARHAGRTRKTVYRHLGKPMK